MVKSLVVTALVVSLASPGATLAQTRAVAEDARERIAKVEHVQSVYTTIGGGSAGADPFMGGAGTETRKATLTILLAERGDRPRKQGIENKIRAALEPLPGVRSTFSTASLADMPAASSASPMRIASCSAAWGPSTTEGAGSGPSAAVASVAGRGWGAGCASVVSTDKG